jgi:hypothetical protein
MNHLITRYPVLVDSRVLTLVVALVLALISFVATGHVALAGSGVINGCRGCGG